MAKTITEEYTRKRIWIVCSTCGERSKYVGKSNQSLWKNRDWYCAKHRPTRRGNNSLSFTRPFWIHFELSKGRTAADVAKQLGISPSRVQQLQNRARRYLKEFAEAHPSPRT